MKFQDLIYFVHLVDSKNFTHTANYFFVSQPSISMAVKRLENDLDTVLIKRNLSERTLELMPAGKILYHNAKEIISLKESAYNEIQSLKNHDYFALTGPSISNPSPPIHESSPPLLSARICTSRQSIRTSSPLTSLFYV